MYISGVPFEQLGFNVDLGRNPYPELTTGFLNSVPLVLIMWPAFFIGIHSFTKKSNQIT